MSFRWKGTNISCSNFISTRLNVFHASSIAIIQWFSLTRGMVLCKGWPDIVGDSFLPASPYKVFNRFPLGVPVSTDGWFRLCPWSRSRDIRAASPESNKRWNERNALARRTRKQEKFAKRNGATERKSPCDVTCLQTCLSWIWFFAAFKPYTARCIFLSSSIFLAFSMQLVLRN